MPRALGVVLCVLFAIGCDSTDATAIGPEGGRVDDSSGAAVEVPAGASVNPVEIAVGAASPSAPRPIGFVPAGPAIAFTPHGTAFAALVTLTVPVDGNPVDVAVFRLDDEADTTWERVREVEPATGTIRVQTDRFSIYAGFMGVPADSDAGAEDGGVTVDAGESSCGDGTCAADEDCASCPRDCQPEEVLGGCPACCGGWVCLPSVDFCTTHSELCSCGPQCGDGICEPGLENCITCPSDCNSPMDCSCGDGACNDTTEFCSCSDCMVCSCGDGTCAPGEGSGELAECPADCEAASM